MASFVAIDFETANESRSSACALGWAIFEDGSVVDAGSTLIAPGIEPDEWSDFNIAVHGITPADVRAAAAFPAAWEALVERADGRPLVAHYAAFDMGVLRAELERYQLSPAPLRYACSAVMARYAWPELLSVSLPLIARHLGIGLVHHDPHSDALACGSVAVAATRQLGAVDLEGALKRASIGWGEIQGDLRWRPSGLSALRLEDMTARQSDFDPSHPLYGKVVAFTGALASMTRREAFQRVLDRGGDPDEGVTKRTNILVVGEQDLAKLAVGEAMSAKQRKAAAMRAKGADIQLISEMDFLESL